MFHLSATFSFSCMFCQMTALGERESRQQDQLVLPRRRPVPQRRELWGSVCLLFSVFCTTFWYTYITLFRHEVFNYTKAWEWCGKEQWYFIPDICQTMAWPVMLCSSHSGFALHGAHITSLQAMKGARHQCCTDHWCTAWTLLVGIPVQGQTSTPPYLIVREAVAEAEGAVIKTVCWQVPGAHS